MQVCDVPTSKMANQVEASNFATPLMQFCNRRACKIQLVCALQQIKYNQITKVYSRFNFERSLFMRLYYYSCPDHGGYRDNVRITL